MDPIYLDNNATTPLLPAVVEAMRPFHEGSFGNPASAHRLGRQARQALEDARESVASLLGAHAEEVVFTSGATESNNLALQGSGVRGQGSGDDPPHLVVSPIEHPSVSEPVRRLNETGVAVSYLDVDASGVVVVEGLPALLRPQTRLVALMLVNHETGAIQPVRRAVELSGGVPVHCDATQTVGKVAVDFHALGVATLSLSAHKFCGPRGVGALLVRRGHRLTPLLHGGHQQRGIRPGTEPVALAVGLACALRLAVSERETRVAHVRRLRERFLTRLQTEAAPVLLNGPADETGVPHTLNLSFPGLKGDLLLMALDLAGVCCSTGSACSSGSLLPSPVLRAMKVPEERLFSSLRFSLGFQLSESDVDEAAARIGRVVKRLRQGSLPC